MVMDTSELATYIRARLTLRIFIETETLGNVQATRDSILPILTKKWLYEQETGHQFQWRVEVDEDKYEIIIDGTN